jgi:3-oxoacyl-[acyl-carrier protein] reductase
MGFNKKTLLVTGGSRGIGRAIARAFAASGARVAIVYRENKSAADSALEELEGEGHIAIAADLADSRLVEQLIDSVCEQFGSLDILVNNAGIGIYHPPAESSYDEWQQAWQQTLQTNLIAPANLCFCAAGKMRDNGGGRIINITSRGAYRGEPSKPAYGASKSALNSLTQSLAVALAPYQIYVAAVAPGFVNTDLSAARLAGEEGEDIKAQSPFNRVAEPGEVAHAVLFLASEGAEFSSGTIIDVNGASYLR